LGTQPPTTVWQCPYRRLSRTEAGPLIYNLCQHENLVLFSINSRTVAHYRRAFQPSRAKSGPVDAHLLIELLLKHGLKPVIDRIFPFTGTRARYCRKNASSDASRCNQAP
jgi:hypothetical protein